MDLGELGARIQSLRTERGWTLQDLAGSASVSTGMLSAVERGQKAATIVVLARIADGLGVPVAGLLATPRRVVLRRAAEQDVIDEPGGWQRTILTPVVPGVNFEWVRTTLPAGRDAGVFPAYAPGSHEFVVVESGALRLTVGDAAHRLEPGDSLYFAADAPHGYANPGDIPCTYYVAALIMRPRRPART
ncbi:XRE family transcriptional regulator [Saccharothrix sp. AJ9571]|nr:XRE family transcriptional regulator [Saccharothrix sp. AJ9571]